VYDSKGLKPEEREAIFPRIMKQALAVGVGAATAEEIDVLNILQATHLAAARAIAAIENKTPAPEVFLTDYLKLKDKKRRTVVPLVKGDAKCHCIAAASIVAKVVRDRMMEYYEEEYPGYGLSKHKGYPTPSHKAALEELGPSGIHRRSFSGVPLFAAEIVKSHFFHEAMREIENANDEKNLTAIEKSVRERDGLLPRVEIEELIEALRRTKGTKGT
jgi:ribonuclease HII